MKISTLRRFLRFAFVSGALVAASGCATRVEMALHDEDERISSSSRPIYLMTATIRNDLHPRYQPRIAFVITAPDGKPAVSDQLSFKMDSEGKLEEEDEPTGNRYLIRLQFAPGRYQVLGVSAVAHGFPFHGLFFAPLNLRIDAAGPAVVYLGHLDATVRERVGDEFRAGPIIPLIDQAATGASGGTFDVAITDSFADDEPILRGRFAALRDVTIVKSIATFDRERAQRAWEAH